MTYTRPPGPRGWRCPAAAAVATRAARRAGRRSVAQRAVRRPAIDAVAGHGVPRRSSSSRPRGRHLAAGPRIVGRRSRDLDCSSTRSSARDCPRSTVGDDHVGSRARSSRQRVSPVAASIPATNDSPGFSSCTITVPPTTSGEEAMPTSLRVDGRLVGQAAEPWRLPSRSKQARSLEEKKAKIRRPSLAGVGTATPPNGLHTVCRWPRAAAPSAACRSPRRSTARAAAPGADRWPR